MKKALLVTEASVYLDKDGDFVAHGGGEMCFHNIARSLLKIGIQPVVFAITEFEDQKAEEEIDGVVYKRVNVKSRTSFKILKYLRDAVRESSEYDFIFLNQFTPHLTLPWLKGFTVAVVHDVYSVYGIRFWIKQYGFFRGVMGSLVEKLQLKLDAKYADKIMTVSDFSKEKIELMMGKKVEGKVFKNPFPIDKNDFIDLPKEDYILFVGRFVDYKNPDHVLFALKKIKEVFPKFKAIFVVSRVDKGLVKKFWERAGDLNLGKEDVVWREMCSEDEIKMLFAKARLLVHPSCVEGQGIVVLESLASRTPVVAYDLAAYKGMLVNRKNCLLVEEGNKEALSKACLEVLGQYESYVERCHDYLVDFSQEKFDQTLEHICSNASKVF